MKGDRTLQLLFVICAALGVGIIVWQNKSKVGPEDEIGPSVVRDTQKKASKTKYPILTRITRGAVPPGGLAVTVGGDFGTTTISAEDHPIPLSADQFAAQLSASIKAAAQTETKVERDNVPPPGPVGSVMPKDGAVEYAPGRFTVSVHANRWSSDVSISRSEEEFDREVDRYSSQVVKQLYARQLSSLTPEAVQKNVSPSGFYVVAKGRTITYWSDHNPLLIIPMDPGAVRTQFQRLLKAAVLQDQKSSAASPPNALQVQIGPTYLSDDIPYAPSSRFPTDADVAREAEKVIARLADESAEQMDKLNKGQG